MSILDQLPPVIKRNVEVDDVKAVPVQVNGEQKSFILACSRDIQVEEMELLKSYGQLLVWDESFRNIPLASHRFDYATFDLREKTHRDALMKEDLSRYHVVCIVSIFDSFDDFIEDTHCMNIIRTLPARQAFKSDFDRLLLSFKIRKPNCLKAIFRSLCFLRDGWPRR